MINQRQAQTKTMTEPIDLLIIGGGINGAGVARDAAGRGLSVVLCEKGDLGEGTSSRSGKYIHGGLRYLEYYEFRLVREALKEREVVLANLPHLSWPLQLVLVHSPAQRPRWLIRLGLFIYDNLGGRKLVPGSSSVNLADDPKGKKIRADFKDGFAYWDVWVDDARLVLLNAKDASRRGAEILPRTECIATKREGKTWRVSLHDVASGKTREIVARAIFNAGGPWVKQVINRSEAVSSKREVRLVKGSHIILKKWWQGDHGYVLQAPDRRLIFVNPYFDDLALIGTTDIPFSGNPEEVKIDQTEIDYLLGILNTYFAIELVSDDVITSYSGVRPLYDDDENKRASAVTRDYVFELDGGEEVAPFLSVFGGKLTTYRKLSERAMRKLKPFFPTMTKDWTATAPLPGGDLTDSNYATWFEQFLQRYPWLPAKLAQHYGRTYGSESDSVLKEAKKLEDLGRHFGANFYQREAEWLIDHEWGQTADDILLRRTKHGIFLSKTERNSFADWLANRNN